jgi:hypothetical protein
VPLSNGTWLYLDLSADITSTKLNCIPVVWPLQTRQHINHISSHSQSVTEGAVNRTCAFHPTHGKRESVHTCCTLHEQNMTHKFLQLNTISLEKRPIETYSSSARHEIPCLMEPNDLLPCSQKPAIGSCPQTWRIRSIPLHSTYWSITTSMEPSPSWEATSCSATQEFPTTFYVTWRFITVCTTARHWPLSWPRWAFHFLMNQILISYCCSQISELLLYLSILILPRIKVCYSSGFQRKMYAFLDSPCIEHGLLGRH